MLLPDSLGEAKPSTNDPFGGRLGTFHLHTQRVPDYVRNEAFHCQWPNLHNLKALEQETCALENRGGANFVRQLSGGAEMLRASCRGELRK